MKNKIKIDIALCGKNVLKWKCIPQIGGVKGKGYLFN